MSLPHAEPSEVPQLTDVVTAAARREKLFDLAIWLGLILSIVAVYAQVGGFDFVYYDDHQYVFQNPHVQAGLTPDSVKWAFTGVVASNWMPVTLLSHMLDVQLFDMASGMHHLVNVLFHTLSALLLFAVLRRATGAPGPSAFVAFVFALHPLHVQSVAWVSERKDVLSAFFWFLALYAYVRYTERPSLNRYLLVAAPFCLGLMSKPMLVTFPFTLLLLDIWPLRRAQLPKTIWEKLPLIALAAVASAVTYFIQGSTGAMSAYPFATRIANAAVSYVTYIGQMFWPTRLACFYPYPASAQTWQAAAAFAAILIVSALTILARRTHPYLAVGWFWYLGTLVPVIGLVQVGRQAHADRYMYIPMVGLLLMLAWGAADAVKKWPRIKPAIATAAVVSCVACMALAWKETAYWQNSLALFQHAIDMTQNNWLAETDLGIYLNAMDRNADAVPHFEAALRIRPDDGQIHNNLGVSLASLGDCLGAVPHFEAALRADPGLAGESLFNIGACQMKSGDYAAAIPNFEASIRAKPEFASTHFSLAECLSKIPGRVPDAISEYEIGLRLTPDDPSAHVKLGEVLASLGRTQEAIAHLEAAQRIHPTRSTSEILERLRAGQK